MPSCRACGRHVGVFESAGLFRWEHKACKDEREAAEYRERLAFARLQGLAMEAALDSDELESFAEALDDAQLADPARERVLASGFGAAVERVLDDDHLTVAEQDALNAYRRRFDLSEPDSRSRRAWERVERAAFARLEDLASDAVLDETLLDEFDTELVAAELGADSRARLLVGAFEHSLEAALDDGILSHEEERAVNEFRERFELSEHDLDRNGLWTQAAEAAVLREVMEGNVPEPPQLDQRLPFNLMKSEDLVWVIADTEYYQTKTVREFRGSSHGVSIRVAKGLYYRPSAFKGRSVSREETVLADRGLLGVTTKHIYFHGDRERFRVRYDRIVSFEPFSDGLGIMRDNQRAKPESFVTGDGWFIYNLVANLSQL